MAKYRVGILGTGRGVRPDGKERKGISYQHAPAYLSHPDAEIVALADLVPENAAAYAANFKIQPALYDHHQKMLAEARLDMVSVCVWTGLHPQMVMDCAAAGVKAIHCEKPMAGTWGDAKRMAAFCAERGVQLTFNHQRRFGASFRKAKELLQDGAIGELERLEGCCPNMMDWGTHWLDMMFFYNDDVPAEWVIAQIDKRTDKAVFGLQMDDQAISWIGFQNGVQGLMTTGEQAGKLSNKLVGSAGVIDIGSADGRTVRLFNAGSDGWEVFDLEGGLHGGSAFEGAIHDAIDSLTAGREPELSARKALQCTEVIFATYESSRRRGRVDLPLDIEDHPMVAMMEAGQMGPNRTN